MPPKPGLGRINSPLLVVILQTGAHSLECSELAFAAPGNDIWTDLLNILSPVLARTNFQDIVADVGKLYALDERSHVLVFDLGGEKPSSSSSRVTVMVIKVKAHSDPRCMKSLAVISGELILVQRWTCKDRPLGLTRPAHVRGLPVAGDGDNPAQQGVWERRRPAAISANTLCCFSVSGS